MSSLLRQTYPAPLRPLVLFGPTASGKSRLALALAEKLSSDNIVTHIVNCDSLQLYTHLPILTAQPTAEDKVKTPHHLYGVAHPSERLSAGLYAEKATQLLQHLQGKHPAEAIILCGGSGLYLKALLGGLTALPPCSREALQKVRRWQEEERDLYALLQQRDPTTAATLVAKDKHRIVRALEFHETYSTSLHDARKGVKQSSPFAAENARQPLLISLTPSRETLYAAINARFERMLQQGAIEEVRALQKEPSLSPDIFLNSPLRSALGLREIEAYGAGEMSWHAMLERGQQRSRNYAKRQLTWIRHQLPDNAELQQNLTESVEEDCNGVCHKVAQVWSKASCTLPPFV